MKPPQRRRKVPARYTGEATGPTAWSPREMRHLLRLLQAQRGQPEPDAAELAKELRGRSEAEVVSRAGGGAREPDGRAKEEQGERVELRGPWTVAEICRFIQQLKGRVVREAIRKVQTGGRGGPRHGETQLPAPIEVWMDLAEKLTGPLEEALTAAFSQVLTIAAAEPLSLLHSKPGKPTKACGRALVFLNTQEAQKDPAPEGSGPEPMTAADPTREASVPELKASGTNPETSGLVPEVSVPDPDAPTESMAGSSTERDFAVDFEKIYKYLSSSSRCGHGPELSAVESAVVLNLLMSLAEELPHLPCTALVDHLTKTYAQLMAPQTSLTREKRPRPGTEDGGTGSTGPEETGQGTPQASEPTEPRPAWKAAGVCPLNPFLVPLDLLSQVVTPAR